MPLRSDLSVIANSVWVCVALFCCGANWQAPTTCSQPNGCVESDLVVQQPATPRICQAFHASYQTDDDAQHSFASVGYAEIGKGRISITCFEADCQKTEQSEIGTGKSEDPSPSAKNPEHEQPTTCWPSSDQLTAELDKLGDHAGIRQLILETRQQLEGLTQCKMIGDERATQLLKHLSRNERQLRDIAAKLSQKTSSGFSSTDYELACELGRFCYRLQRRVGIWNRVNQLAQHSPQNAKRDVNDSPIRFADSRRISLPELTPSWSEYLMLDQVRSAFESFAADREYQKNSARQILARIYSPALSPRQSQYLQQIFDSRVVEFLRSQAVQPVDFKELLADLESYEAKPSGYNASRLNDHYQNFFWSAKKSELAIAADLEAHYRNANLRIAISEQFLNRLIPQLPSTMEPFSEHILGAQVDGQNKISSKLHVQLIPNPQQIQLKLTSLGQIDSNTVARRDGFAIQSQGRAHFDVSQQLSVDRTGIRTNDRPQASSSAQQNVVGLNSKFDPMPVVGRVANRVARRKIQNETPKAERLFENRVSNDAADRMAKLVEAEIRKVRKSFTEKLLNPMIKMDLEPETIQLASTDKEVILRYRLAGRDQMAAHTVRPVESGPNLLNLQLHESIINNTLSRVELNSNKFNVADLKSHLQDKLGLVAKEDESKPEKEAEFEFARFDPVRVDFKDDRIFITMKLNSLKIADGSRWKRVTMTAAYVPQYSGMKLELIQDEQETRIKGHRLRFRDRAAIGTVHKALFKRQYEFDALPAKYAEKIGGPELEVSQLVASNGWVSISINDALAQTQSDVNMAAAHGAIKSRSTTQ